MELICRTCDGSGAGSDSNPCKVCGGDGLIGLTDDEFGQTTIHPKIYGIVWNDILTRLGDIEDKVDDVANKCDDIKEVVDEL